MMSTLKTFLVWMAVGVVFSPSINAETISYNLDVQDVSMMAGSRPVPSNLEGMQQHIMAQDERIDGLITIIEGLSASLNELRSQADTTPQYTSNHNDNSEVLQKLANMIDEINNNYVSKKELDAILDQHKVTAVASKTSSSESNYKEEVSYKDEGSQTSQSESFDKDQSNASLYNEGVRLFVKKRYADAKDRFLITAQKGYKPAASNYYLGEIAYYTDASEDAIFYFKKSAGLYGEATYMDTLLLHTAISLVKIGEIGQARAFFENIIETYPDNKTATIAKDRLEKI